MGKTGKTFYANDRTSHFITNGKWVLEGVSCAPGYHQWFIGAHEGLQRIEIELLYGQTSKVVWVGEQPFGILRWDKTDGAWLPTGGISFESAKQVNNGQLGHLTPIPKLARVHELGEKVAWSRVSDLVELSGYRFAEIVERFWPFVDRSYQPWHPFPATLKMVLVSSADEIRTQQRKIEEFTQKDLLDKLQNNSSFYNNAWIPASLGRTILRLIALGYEPIGATST
ncbi:MAG TPA: hypothetical protein VD907_06230 [Verrucomicrobiae bacterium]|nr:hypothetical protein [Verrucomicrobiae bacterium]